MTAAATAAHTPAGKDIFGHPRGLWYLCFCEGFERFSYYGMQALLVLYLTQYLLLPGHIEHVAGFLPFRDALASLYGPLGTPVAGALVAVGAGSVCVGRMMVDRVGSSVGCPPSPPLPPSSGRVARNGVP